MLQRGELFLKYTRLVGRFKEKSINEEKKKKKKKMAHKQHGVHVWAKTVASRDRTEEDEAKKELR